MRLMAGTSGHAGDWHGVIRVGKRVLWECGHLRHLYRDNGDNSAAWCSHLALCEIASAWSLEPLQWSQNHLDVPDPNWVLRGAASYVKNLQSNYQQRETR